MVNGIDNFIIYNAPAGSGKTTTIKKMVRNFQVNEPDKNIMCITFTNRAADELMSKINNKKIYCSTIHGCLNYLFKPYFKHPEIIKLYFEVFKNEINKRIDNVEKDTKRQASNEKYIEKYGELKFDTLRNNIKEITYGEIPFSSYYYGILSHDDLLIFCNEIIKKFPKIRNKIKLKYKRIFIDEYQDTSSEVLYLFYEALKDSNSTLYVFGDKMQQIYNNYDGKFDDKFSLFQEKSLNINYRSSSEIVGVLNKIYNNSKYNQSSYNGPTNITPTIILYKNNLSEILEKDKNKNSDLLVLYLLNSEKYKEIDAYNLYSQVNSMEKYNYHSRYRVNNILENNSIDNPDKLFRLLFLVCELVKLFENNQIGRFIHLVKNNSLFEKKNVSLKNHGDKIIVYNKIKKLIDEFYSDVSIEEFVNYLVENKWIKNFSSIIEDLDYANVLKVKLEELISIDRFLRNPLISTQHGVKGESHDSVAFISADSSNPNVKMTDFYRLYSSGDVSVTDLEDFNKKYMCFLMKLKNELSIDRISNLKAAEYKLNNIKILSMVKEYIEENKDSIYYQVLLEKDINDYLLSDNLTKFKSAIKENKLSGVITAYKLFYVGCSRARKILYIYVKEDMIKDFKSRFIDKMKNIGFVIKEESF